MQLLILAFPEQPISITALSDLDLTEAEEQNRQLEKTQCWHGDFLTQVAAFRDKYSANDIMVCGPSVYVTGLVDQIKDYYENDLTLNVWAAPMGGDKPEGIMA